MTSGTRPSALLVALLAGVGAGGLAGAADAAPGCTFLQPQVKRCTVSAVGGVGTFDVAMAPPAGLVVLFEEPILGMQPPPASSYRASFDGKSATVVPLRMDPIAGATVHFDTASLHVTLRLVRGQVADSQILVVDPRRVARDEEIERRVREGLAGVDERVARRVDELLVEEVARVVEVAAVEARPARHEQVVVRATEVVRIGKRAVLRFQIENRGGEDVEVARARVWVGSQGAEREIAGAVFAIDTRRVASGEERRGAVLLPGVGEGGAVLRLRVELGEAGRTVEVEGIRMRGVR